MKNKLALLMALGLALPAMALAQDSDERPARNEDRRPRFERDAGERPERRERPERLERQERPARRDGDDREAPGRPHGREDRAGQEGFRREGLHHGHGYGPGMKRAQGFRPMRSPLIMILDVNRNGVIEAAEIERAPRLLRRLDKNGDGKLTQGELAMAFRHAGAPRQMGGEHFRSQRGPGREENRPDRGARLERRNDDERPNRGAERGGRVGEDRGNRDQRDRGDAPRAPRRPLPQEDRE